jgi:transposase
MFDVNDDAKGGFRRIELLTGPGRRRKWSAEEKARIVAETLEPGARVAEVARRWQVCPQQVFGWRREARQEMPTQRADATIGVAHAFVPIVAETNARAGAPRAAPALPVIELKLAGAVVRVVSGSDDGTQLTAVLRAVRASAAEK